MPRSAPRSRARCAVFEAQQLRRDHDVVVHVVADRLRVLDLLLVELDERLHRLGPAHREAQHAETHRAPPSRTSTGCPAATHIGGCGFEYGFGSTLRGRHREEPAVEARVLLVAPHLAELADHLVEHVAREVGIGDAEAALLGGGRTAAHAELEAAFATSDRASRPARRRAPGGSPAA